MLAPGSWWLHATLSGEEQLEWQLPVTVGGARQTVKGTLKSSTRGEGRYVFMPEKR